MTVTLDHPTDFRTLAQVAGIEAEQLRELNPALIRWSTPPGVSPYSLRVPASVKPDFLDALGRIPPHERVAWIAHRVRKNETSVTIAKRYGAHLQAFLEMNGLNKRQPLKPGTSVLVPASPAFLPNRTADAAVDRPKTQTASTASVRHTVKKGETVAQIARAYGVSHAEHPACERLVAERIPSPRPAPQAARRRGPGTVSRRTEGLYEPEWKKK